MEATRIRTGGTTKNHGKKMKTSEFQRTQRFSFCFNCAKYADLGISIVPNSWLFFEPLIFTYLHSVHFIKH